MTVVCKNSCEPIHVGRCYIVVHFDITRAATHPNSAQAPLIAVYNSGVSSRDPERCTFLEGVALSTWNEPPDCLVYRPRSFLQKKDNVVIY